MVMVMVMMVVMSLAFLFCLKHMMVYLCASASEETSRNL